MSSRETVIDLVTRLPENMPLADCQERVQHGPPAFIWIYNVVRAPHFPAAAFHGTGTHKHD